MTDRELLTAAIEASGLSARKLATLFLVRDERTIRRWESGEIPIPEVARKRLSWLVALHAVERRRFVRTLTG